jgi:hypothetical protein
MTPKQKVAVIGIIVLALVGAFAAGRYTLSPKVVEVEKQVEVVKEVVRTEVQFVEKRVYIRGEARDVVREVVIIKKPDGTEETRTTETDKTVVKEASSQEASSQVVQVVEKEKLVEKERIVIVEAHKDWHLSLSAGAGARFIGDLTPQLVFGLTAERRIIGPFFMGLNLSTSAGIKPGPSPLAPPVTVTGSLVFGLEL